MAAVTEAVIECKYSDIVENCNNVCQFVSNHCDYSYINFYEIHYCFFKSYLWLTIPLFSCLAIICFYLLSDTSNKYLSQSLTIISDKLKISQNLAGLTFLAFGNGAPDVISSIVASGDAEDGIDFSMGALMGAGVFVTCFVLSSVVHFSKEVKVNKYKFLRDIIVYLLTIGLLGLFSLDGKIKLWESIFFCSIYFFYVILAFFMDKCWAREGSALDPEYEEQIAESIASEVAIVHYKNKSQSFLLKNDQERKLDQNLVKNLLESSEEEKKEKNEVYEKLSEEGYLRKSIISQERNNKSSFLNNLKNEHFYDSQEGINQGQEQVSSMITQRKKSLFNKLVHEQYGSLLYRIKKNYFSHTEA
jgi:Ca2+/Na+ antiporter